MIAMHNTDYLKILLLIVFPITLLSQNNLTINHLYPKNDLIIKSQDDWGKKNYKKVNSYRTSEGRCLKIPYKGEISETIEDLLGGLRSTCTYTNSFKVEDLKSNVKFMLVYNQFNSSLI